MHYILDAINVIADEKDYSYNSLMSICLDCTQPRQTVCIGAYIHSIGRPICP